MTQEQAQNKFTEWQHAQRQLAEIKEKEMQLRLEVGAHYFPEASAEGTHTIKLPEGWKLQYVTKVSRTLENKKGETNSIASQLPPELRDGTISWKPSLKLKGYKNLPAEYRVLVDSIVTSKPSTPALKLIPPKETK